MGGGLMALLTTILVALAPLLQPPNAELKPLEPVMSSPAPGGAVQQAGARALPASAAAPAPESTPVLACIRRWESLTSGLYHAISPGGRYRGAYQFDFPTWEAVGGQGDPASAPPSEQDWRALLLLRLRGLAPWPTPARECA